MNGYHDNIEQETKKNDNFRKVVFTGVHSQLVLMSIKPGEDIGLETHPNVDQFFRIESGEGSAVIDGEKFGVKEEDAVVVPAGSEHNITNTGSSDLKLYTIYSPANHPKGTIHKTKAEAEEAEHDH